MKMCADCNSPTQCKAAKKCLGPKKAKMGGKMKAYKSGGKITDKMTRDEFVKKFSEKPEAPDLSKIRKAVTKKARGGKIDGCAMRGRTRGRTV